MDGNHQRYEELIDELVLDGGDAADHSEAAAQKWRELRAHVAGCARCRERYNRVSMAERMLHGGAGALDSPSPASFERIGAALLGDADPTATAWQRMVQWLRPQRRWVGGLAAAAALAVLIPFYVARPHSQEFQARGRTAGERQAGVRAFCLDGTGVSSRCTRASQLRLTISNAGQFRYVFLVGLDEAHAIKWYAPRPSAIADAPQQALNRAPETSSIAAPSGIDVPVGDAIRLGVNHDAGPLRIYAIFSDAPVSAAEIESTVERMHSIKLSPAEAGALPLQRTDVVQHSVALDIAP